MKYNDLNLNKQRQKNRVGRGIAAGQGKTAGRGTKGQGARAGYSKKPGFAGGSNPLMQKLPKLPGFKSHRVKPEVVYTSDLEALKLKTVDASVLAKANLISSPYISVKLLNKGKLTSAISVKLPKASASAVAALESAGGSFEPVPRLARPKAKKTED